MIRSYISNHTPLGTYREDVLRVIMDSEGWEARIVGDTRIEAYLGSYTGIFTRQTNNLFSTWRFDEDNKLIEIHVRR